MGLLGEFGWVRSIQLPSSAGGEVVFAEGGGVGELELLNEPGTGLFTFTDGLEQAFYLVAYLVGHLL